MANRQKIFLISGIIVLALVALAEGILLLRQSGGGSLALALAPLLGSKTDFSPARNRLGTQENIILRETADDLERMQNQINRLFHEMTRTSTFDRRNTGLINRTRNPFIPADNIHRLQSEIARIFRSEYDNRHDVVLDLIERDWHNVDATSSLNMGEDETNYVVTVSMPGFEKNDINISINNRILTIEAKGERQNDAQNRQSIQSGRFKTQIMLPSDINDANTRAFHRNGILRVMIPKKLTTNSLARKVKIL